jgi:hypothetical protein
MFSLTSHFRLSLKTGLVSLLSLVSIFSAGPSLAAHLSMPSCLEKNNCSFEKGNFTGWKRFGNTSIETANYGSGPTDGAYQALLTTVTEQTRTDVELAEFLNVNPNDLLNLGNVIEGSAIKTTFTVKAGDVVKFDWNFLADDSQQEMNNDFAFVTLALTKLADTFSIFVNSPTPFSNETGFKTFSYQFETAGTYTLGIGVVDVGDPAGDSGLLVDNLTITAGDSTTVPEPASVLGLLGFGALGVGSRLLRKH